MKVIESEVTQAAPERDTPFNVVMKIWARWMTLADRQEPGGWGHPQDIKEFMRTGEAVDAMIDDLPRVQWWAVRKAHGIATVWRFPDLSFADAMAEAEEKLTAKMLLCVDTRRYFN
jgi:hypothetical protein